MSTITTTNGNYSNTISNPCGTWTTDTYIYTTNGTVNWGTSVIQPLEPKQEEQTKPKQEGPTQMLTIPHFGTITDDSIRASIKGIAVKNADNKYVIYNLENNAIEDITPYTIKGNYIYSIPVQMKDVMLNDIILHQKHYCYVIDGDETSLTVIDLHTNEQRIIYPARSPFGYNYIIKIGSLIDCGTASAENPFGNPALLCALNSNNDNLLPFLLMNKTDIDPTLLMLAASNNSNNILPLLLYLNGTAKK